MDYEIALKFATFAIGSIGAAKVLYELSMGKLSRMREEYKFAKEFLAEVSSNDRLHPYLREKGFQAIAGDNQLGAEEIDYLLSLQGPDRALKDYVLGRPYLEHLPHAGNLQINFRKKYCGIWSRRWRKYLYLGLYFVLAFLAFSPLLLAKLYSGHPKDMFIAFVACLVVFGPYAYFAVKAASRIVRAEKLVQNQHKHTQVILLSS